MGSSDDEVDAALAMCQAYYATPCQRAWFEVEQPVHPVVLDGFWLDRTEVTNGQYRRCVEAGTCTQSLAARLCMPGRCRLPGGAG
jgi:sulfatase modifying factor 1